MGCEGVVFVLLKGLLNGRRQLKLKGLMNGEFQEAEWSSGFPQLKRILVPVDFSVAGVGAVRSAVSLAAHFAAEMTFFHVLEPVTDDPDIVLHWMDFPRQRREYALREMEKLAGEMGVPAAE